jgi:hypothetical protein
LALFAASFAAALRFCSAIIPLSDLSITAFFACAFASLYAAAPTAFNNSLMMPLLDYLFLTFEIVTSIVVITIVLSCKPQGLILQIKVGLL